MGYSNDGRNAIRHRLPALIALAALLELCFLALLRAPGASSDSFPAWMIAAGLFYLIAITLLPRRPAPAAAAEDAAAADGPRRELRFILLAAVVFRLTLLPLSPRLSHEMLRYHWDGKIQHAGFNPYQYPPSSALFTPIRSAADALAPAPDLPAFHPPLAELLFHWNFDLGGIRRQKVLYTILDLLLLGLLVRVLRARGRPPAWVAVYAWSPLAVVEIAGQGHMESATILLLLLALHWTGRRVRLSGAAAAAAVLTQWFAWVLAPVVLAGSGRRWWRALGWGVGLGVVITLPYLWMNKHFAPGVILANALQHAREAGQFNASVFAVAASWFGPHAALALAVAVVGAVIATCALRRLDPLRSGFFVLGALLLVMPAVEPWYVLWLLPLLAIWPEAPWLYFAAAVPLAYALPAHPWLLYAEYLPLFGLLIYQGVRPFRRSN